MAYFESNGSKVLTSPDEASGIRAQGWVSGPVLLILCSLLAVFLAGGAHQGAVGLFFLCSGVVLILRSPQRSTPWSLWGLVILLVILDALSLAPSHGIPGSVHLPWREMLGKVPGIHLHGTLSMSPYDTAGWAFMLLLSLLVVLQVLGSPLQGRGLILAASVGLGGVLFYAGLALLSWKTGWNYPFFVADTDYPKVFGFFPNRNHSAGFLATGAILSLGIVHSGTRQNFLLRIAAVGAFVFLAYCLLFVSISRGGVVALGLGVVIWMIGLGGRHRPWWLLPCMILVVALIGLRFAASGSDLLQRFRGEPLLSEVDLAASGSTSIPAPTPVTADARIALAKDTLKIIHDYPLTGTGAGTYAAVYPFYASASLMDKTSALHPESDWLMLAAECGVPALLVSGAGLCLLLRRIPVLKSVSDGGWPLRWAFISAFLAEILHGVVDVPLHRLELGWWVMILGGIGFALPSGSSDDAAPQLSLRIQRLLLLGAGLAMIAYGGWMIGSQWFGARDLPPFESVNGRDRVLMRYAYADTSMEQLAPIFLECDRLIARYPMNGEVPHQYAIFLVQEHRDLPLAERLFGQSRALGVFNADLAFFHGKFLIGLDPKETLRIWREALEFQMRLDAAPKSTVPRTEELFSQMINESVKHPEVMGGLRDIASLSPRLQVAWLEQSTAPAPVIVKALEDRDFMARLSRREQSRLFERCWERGGRDDLKAFLATHPEFADAATITRGRILLDEGKSREACELLTREFGVTLDPKLITMDPDNLRAANELEQAFVYLRQGNGAFARHYLFDAQSHGASPLESTRLGILLDMQAGNYAAAFSSLLDYLRLRGDL